MKIEIKIPSMGESVSEAIVSTIIRPSGSLVKTDEEILELETDKVNQVLYAPQGGKLTLTVKAEDQVTIGQVIGYIDTSVENPASVSPAPTPSAHEIPEPIPQAMPQPPQESARKMIPDFVKEVRKSSEEAPKSAVPKMEGTSTRKKMTGLRKVIAQRLVEAKNQTAMLTSFNEIDMSTVMEIRHREKDTFIKKHGVKLGFMSFFVKGVVAALKAIPEINAAIDGDEIIQYYTYDIGLAVSTERGLMVPVMRNCDTLTFSGIESSLEKYAKKAREGTISVDDLRGGSFTITNGGVFGSLLSTPILNPPQSAILGMHSIVKRPVVVDDQIVIRPMMYVALSYDHRIVDGKQAVLFLVNLKQILEDPSRLLLDL